MFPGFPVDVFGVGALHADFLIEIRTRGYVQRCVTGNPDTWAEKEGRSPPKIYFSPLSGCDS
jgi:hypothetical protein